MTQQYKYSKESRKAKMLKKFVNQNMTLGCVREQKEKLKLRKREKKLLYCLHVSLYGTLLYASCLQGPKSG